MRFCIVGTGRCGSTLLARLLNAHPQVFVFNETHWIPTLQARFSGVRALAAAYLELVARTRHANGRPVTEIEDSLAAELARAPAPMTVRGFCDALGGAFAARAGKPFWADKTPDYCTYMSVIQSLWPDCRFVNIVRDGSAVARSMSKHPGYQVLAARGALEWVSLALDFVPAPGDSAPVAPGAFVRLWHDRFRATRAEAEKLSPGSYVELRYEDLLADPRGVLDRLAPTLGLERDAAWLDRAAAIPKPEKLEENSDAAFLGHFDAPALALMRELGYPTR